MIKESGVSQAELNKPWMSCDWGDCDASTVGYRNDPYGRGWLPVCQFHYDQEPDDNQVAKWITKAELTRVSPVPAEDGAPAADDKTRVEEVKL